MIAAWVFFSARFLGLSDFALLRKCPFSFRSRTFGEFVLLVAISPWFLSRLKLTLRPQIGAADRRPKVNKMEGFKLLKFLVIACGEPSAYRATTEKSNRSSP